MHSLTSIPLIGTPVPPGSTVVRTAVAWLGLSNFPWVLGVVIVSAALIVWSCARSTGLSRPRWMTLVILRLLTLAAVALLLLRPTLRVTFDRTLRPSLPILIDGTASMSTPDKRLDPADVIRMGIADGTLDPARGLHQPAAPTTRPAMTREAIVQSAFKNPKLSLLPALQKRFDLQPFLFADSLAELPADWVDHLTDTGSSTPLGDDLQDLLARIRGRPVAGIVLVTDGRNNAGSPPPAAAELAESLGVKLFIYGVGTVHPKDIVVSGVYAPEIAFLKDTVPVTVRVTGVGYHGEPATLVVRLGTKTFQQQITLDPQEHAFVVPVTPEDVGTFDLTASIDPRPEEADDKNNTDKTRLTVTDKKIRVLLVDSSPGWDFKYLQAALLADPRVTMHCLLQDGDPAVAGDAGPYIRKFPATRADLINNYDLLILGDVDPAAFTADQIASITAFVADAGGGLLFVPGRRFGLKDIASTTVGDMLPVTPGGGAAASRPGAGTTPIHLQLTPAGRTSQTLKLAADDLESQQIWDKRLPPVFWDVPVEAKRSAEVLLVDPGTSGHPVPVLAVQQYKVGQVMFLGTDNTWRWRQNSGEAYYTAFWSQIVQRLALPHLLGQNRRTQLRLDKKTTYSVGDAVTVYARLYDQGFVPLAEPKVPGVVTVGDRTIDLPMTPVPGEPGEYRGSFIAPAEGDYKLHLARDYSVVLEFEVKRTSRELTDSALDEDGLIDLAKTTGGRFFREEDLKDLPAAIAATDETVRSTADVDLGASPIWFGVILLLATVEWILRKIFQLK
jgi:hypothetical protein